MQPLKVVLLASLLTSMVLTAASAGPCADVKVGTQASVYIPCFAHQDKELDNYKVKIQQLETEVHDLKAQVKTLLAQPDLVKRIEEISGTLYGDVDSVYTINDVYALDSPEIRPTLTYIYADPTKHEISAVIMPRGLIPIGKDNTPFSYDLLINRRRIYQHANALDENITKHFQYSLQGTGGGGREEDDDATNRAMIYPPFVQLIEIRPHLPKDNKELLLSFKGKTVSMQGYIIVKRKLAGLQRKDISNR